MATKQSLEIEVQELTEALKESDNEIDLLGKEIELLGKELKEITSELANVKEELYVAEAKSLRGSMNDNIKYELFIEYFDKISLTQFENFIAALEFF